MGYKCNDCTPKSQIIEKLGMDYFVTLKYYVRLISFICENEWPRSIYYAYKS